MYATKDQILGIIKFLRPDYTRESIDQSIMDMTGADINKRLRRAGITTPAVDIDKFLTSASICHYIEIAGMLRETETAFGVIGTETVGNYTKKYENGMPMFFFAQGSSESFLELLPHESWRMRGYKYVTAYMDAYFTDNNDGPQPAPSVINETGWHST